MKPFQSVSIPHVPTHLTDGIVRGIARRIAVERDHILAEVERIGSSSIAPNEKYGLLRALGDQSRDLFEQLQRQAKDAAMKAGERAAASIDSSTVADARESQRLAGELAVVARRMFVDAEFIYTAPKLSAIDNPTGQQLLDAALGDAGESLPPDPPKPPTKAALESMSGQQLLDHTLQVTSTPRS